MNRRKDEITRSRLRSGWPHHVALPAEKVQDLAHSKIVHSAAAALSASPLTYHVRRDGLDRLRGIVERIENLESERAGLAADVKDILAEAKSAGFDVRAIHTIIRLRKQEKDERDERQAIVAEYMNALGMLAELPLGQAAIARCPLYRAANQGSQRQHKRRDRCGVWEARARPRG